MPTATTDQGIIIPIGPDGADNPQAFIDMIAGVESRLVLRYTDLANRAALHTAPVENQITGLATENRFDAYDGANYVSLGTRAHNNFLIRNSSAGPVNNSTVLVTDATLTAPIIPSGASSVYLFSCLVFYDSATAADVKFAFTVPAGVLRWGGMGLAATTTGTVGEMKNSSTATSGATIEFGGSGVGVVVWCRMEGWLSATAAGNIALQYAQQTADATNTTIRAGSWLRVTKMT